MTEQIGLWRATYSPGEWVVLGGPTSLVVLQPAPAQSSPIVERLWRVVLKADSLDDLIAELALHNVSKMPDFAAFFWRDNAMRSLIRGELEIVDLDSGRVIAGANEMVTWSEVDLGHVRRVRVNCESGGRATDRLVLPLVVGAVTASFVELDATPRALVSSPQPLGSAPTQTETNQQHEGVDPFGAIERSADQSPAPVSPVPGLAPVAELEPARSAVVDAVVVDDHSVGAPEVEGDDAADSDLLAAAPGTSPALSDQSEAADESGLAGSAGDRAESDAAVADSAEAAAEPPAALDPFGRTEVYHAFGPDGEDVEEPEVPGFEAHPGFEAKPGAQSEPVIESEPAFALDADTEAEPEASPFGRPAAAEPDASPFGRPLSAEQPPLAEQPGQDERSAVDGDDQPVPGDQGASAEQPSADERPAPASSDPHNPFSLAAVQDHQDAAPRPSTPFGASAPAPAGPSAPFGASAGSAAGVAS
ncbi:MAG: hypothetical protein Q4G46_12235, partial [Propionibacteriaceae bacterium]|nr:hypothetical protein [Propionibacteriaceae bacterium]